jgi:5-methylcytosine-specific restriction endonuclease McrA
MSRRSDAERAQRAARDKGRDDGRQPGGIDPDEGFPPGLAMAMSGGVLGDGLNARVLVLNRLYSALRIISARRAFCLLCNGIVEVIHVEPGEHGHQFVNYDFASWADLSQLQREFERERHDWVKTVRRDIAVPRIVRLLGYDRMPEELVKLNRRNLFARDRNQCQYCGRTFPTADLSIDHVLPRAQGGGDTWTNLVCACIKCNARKGGRTPEQAGMMLIRGPVKPKRNPLITLKLGNEKYASWKAFLDNAYWDVELR